MTNEGIDILDWRRWGRCSTNPTHTGR